MWLFAAIVQIVICLFLILVILLNSGKGAEMGAVFAGGSDSLLGASGGLSFITKLTAFAALLYMVSSATLTLSQRSSALEGSLLKEVATTESQAEIQEEKQTEVSAEAGGEQVKGDDEGKKATTSESDGGSLLESKGENSSNDATKEDSTK